MLVARRSHFHQRSLRATNNLRRFLGRLLGRTGRLALLQFLLLFAFLLSFALLLEVLVVRRTQGSSGRLRGLTRS